MTTTACTVLAIVAVLLTLPFVILWRMTETPQLTARRLRRSGLSYRAIAGRLHVSPTTARRYVLAAS